MIFIMIFLYVKEWQGRKLCDEKFIFFIKKIKIHIKFEQNIIFIASFGPDEVIFLKNLPHSILI